LDGLNSGNWVEERPDTYALSMLSTRSLNVADWSAAISDSRTDHDHRRDGKG
jgi:hypothetical protein